MKPVRKKISTSGEADWSAAWLRMLRRRLLAWYRRSARDLAWRRTSDPYAIWVSEIMLQQTQVATVERYYPRFLAEFPTIAALAAASEQRVLRQWEGLGYYRRARQLHAAAKLLVAEQGGGFPRDVEQVRALPGIGRYTAGAIFSIAFDARLPILEANTIRLFSRLLAYAGDTAGREGQAKLWQAADDLLPARGSGEMNQALMELGSLICTPREPKCGECPLRGLCPTERAGLQSKIPAPREAVKITEVREAAVIVTHRGKVLLRQCAEGERWAGLWDFPRFAIESRGGNGEAAGPVAAAVKAMTGVAIGEPEHLTTLRHGVTRYRITLDCYTASRAGRMTKTGHPLHWLSPEELDDYPLCVTGRRLAKLWRAQRGAAL